MKRRFAALAPWWCAVLLCLALGAGAAWAQEAAGTKVVLDLSEELLLFGKFVVWAGAIFLIILAGLGVMFFGFDVRKARAELLSMTKEIRDLSADFRNEHGNMIRMKNDIMATKAELERSSAESTRTMAAMQAGLEQTIAAMEQKIAEAENSLAETVKEAERRLQELGAHIEAVVDQTPVISIPVGKGPAAKAGSRTVEDLIREVIKSGSFDWTTMDRLTKKTGLDRDAIMQTAQGMPEIEIGVGKKTQDHIFKLRDF